MRPLQNIAAEMVSAALAQARIPARVNVANAAVRRLVEEQMRAVAANDWGAARLLAARIDDLGAAA